ncbi:MAG: MFS transporter [Opitutales bacterium]
MKTETQTDRLPGTFWWHNCTQSLGALNDNLFKLFMIYALITWHGTEAAPNILAKVGFTFAIPYLLIVPIAGSFADKFSKHRIIGYLKSAELCIMGLGVLSLSLERSGLLYLTMFLMSAQSACFGPCKYGIIPEQVSSGQLSNANGLLQLFTFLAIICGTVLAPELSLLMDGQYHIAACACLIVAAAGRISATQIIPSPAHPERPLRLNGFKNLQHSVRFIRTDGYLTLAILAAACFSLCAAFIQLNILDYGHDVLGLSHEESTRLFLLTAVGIGIGSFTAGWISGRGIEFGIVPIGAGLMAVCLIVLSQLGSGDLVIAGATLLLLGSSAGLFIVPLESFIQFSSPPERTGSIQAVNSFCSWVGILIASGLLYINTNLFGWDAPQGFLMLAVILISLTLLSLRILTDFFVKFIVMLITRFCYRMDIDGLDRLPNRRPALIVSNHVSLMDAVFIVSSQQRRIRMLMSRKFYDESNWLTRKIVELGQVILIHTEDNPKKLIQSLKTARTALDEGYLVCIFAEGALSPDGTLQPFKAGFERIIKGSDYPIIPVHIGGAWESVGSHKQGDPVIHPLRDFGTRIQLTYGPPLPTRSTPAEVNEAVRRLAPTETRTGTEANLGEESIRHRSA